MLTTSLPSRIGKAKADRNPLLTAADRRGKFSFSVILVTQIGDLLAHARPGNPVSGENVVFRLIASNCGTLIEGIYQVSIFRSNLALRSTLQRLPTSHSRFSQIARRILGTVSISEEDSAR